MRTAVVVLCIHCSMLAVPAGAADVSFSVSSRETYVGIPITLSIVIENAKDFEPPQVPEMPDAEVTVGRTNSFESTSINAQGAIKRTSITYVYHIKPSRLGVLTIPSITVVADGQTSATPPTTINVKEPGDSDKLFLRVIANRDQVYVGEPLDVTLQIWIQVFDAPRVRMDENDMWQTIDQPNSQWGPFIENLRQRPVDVRVRTEVRADDRGERARYYVYSLNREMWPERPGVFKADGVKVVVNYPTRVSRNRMRLLGPRHRIEESEPIVAVVRDSAIRVLSPPPENRPDSYRNAVGDYAIKVSATPTEVSVGDPITLNITVRGNGRLDVLQAPPLAQQESLTADFRVPDEVLAGVVTRDEKSFNQSIRAKHDGVTEIPPIEFSYFDPRSEEYVTLKSDPIPLVVKPSSRMSVSQMVESGEVRSGGSTQLTVAESGLLANYENVDGLLSVQTVKIGPTTWGVVGSGPALYCLCLLVRKRRHRLKTDTAFARRRSAHRNATKALSGADAQGSVPDAAAAVTAAVTDYMADRCNLPGAGFTRGDAIRELNDRAIDGELVGEIDALLTQCEGARYGAAAGSDADDLLTRARAVIDRLERTKF